MKKAIRVVELFAGVGGFRIGLERASPKFKTVWSNQWEPASKKQQASDIYVARFGGKGHVNADISTVTASAVPDHDLLVGGFPCQDYSVARTLNSAGGLQGKKGVLWWEIHRLLKEKRPPHLLLENVDRLLKSPAKQRGRDFAVMLASLADLGYVVEWRVVNAADYGMPQRRKRIFFIGHLAGTEGANALSDAPSAKEWLLNAGTFARAFPVVQKPGSQPSEFTINGDLVEITNTFNASGSSKTLSPFFDAGLLVGRRAFTLAVKCDYHGGRTVLGDLLVPEKEVPLSYFIPPEQEAVWAYLKGGKREDRTNRTTGFKYRYAEGAMAFPDDTAKAARTVITAEGGPTPSRFKHLVRCADGRLRRLLPVELERLNMFPDGHTQDASDTKRAFLMGNALVTGVVERVGQELVKLVASRR
ncbi:MAG: DNA (cytosine-5-)-methyltransferase [Flavobacteriales bacterium]|nr:DNA (cytosine-5-)-methyltransferase [Flavobacteriales bacterium]